MKSPHLIYANDEPLPSFIQISTCTNIYNIPLTHILYIESHQKRTLLHTKTESLLLPVPLYRITEMLPPTLFVQTHRSYLVNFLNISYIDKKKDPWTIFFFDSPKYAFVSRRFRRHVIDAITLSD